MQHGIDLTMEMTRAQEKLERRPQKHSAFLNFLIEQCEDLHTWMVENQIDDDGFDAAKLRMHYLGAHRPKVDQAELGNEDAGDAEGGDAQANGELNDVIGDTVSGETE
jgi:hypothetical protein